MKCNNRWGFQRRLLYTQPSGHARLCKSQIHCSRDCKMSY